MLKAPSPAEHLPYAGSLVMLNAGHKLYPNAKMGIEISWATIYKAN